MANLFIAGVGNVDLFKGSESVLVSKTLVDSSINLSVSLEDVRAGAGAKLYGRYAHSSGMTMKLTDAMFRMEFLAANIGADVELGGSAVAMITKTVTNGKISLPEDIEKLYDEMTNPIIWIAKQDGKMEFIPFEIKDNVKEVSDLPWAEGTNVCVRYIKPHEAGQTLKVSANFIPDTLTAVLTAPLFAGDVNNMEASTKIGTLTITIPRFMLNGTTDLAMSMTGAAQMTLEGSALAVEDEACDGEGYYAIISKVLTNGKWYDGLVGLVIEDGDSLTSGEKLTVYGKFAGIGNILIDESKYSVICPEGKVVYENGVLFNLTKEIQEITVKLNEIPLIKTKGYLNGMELTEEELELLEQYGTTDITPTDESVFTYSINDDNTITITGTNKPSSSSRGLEARLFGSSIDLENIVIPYEIEGKTVVEIGEAAFKFNSVLNSVIIPNSITSIGDYAFESCSNLTNVVLGNGVKNIGEYAFSESGVTNIIMGDNVLTIGIYAFYTCMALESVIMGNNITSINEAVFANCVNLATVKISNSLKTIEASAFCSCNNLKSIVIPNSVTSIGNEAFGSCVNLTSITLPENITSIGELTFASCSSLTDIIIPNSIVSIGDSAFANCSNLTSAQIGEGLTTLGNNCFEECGSLQEVVFMGNNIEEIGGTTFVYCSELKNITIPDGVVSIGDGAFRFCNSLTDMRIPNSVTSIGADAFSYCEKMMRIDMSNNITNIGDLAFEECSNLTIYGNANNIYAQDYAEANNIPFVSFEDLITYYGDESVILSPASWFSYDTSSPEDDAYLIITSGLNPSSEYVIPFRINGRIVKEINLGAFSACDTLTNVIIPNSVTSIGDAVFSGCTNLTNVNIPNSVTSIGGAVFSDCTNLTNIIIPNSVTYIGDSVFRGCFNLDSIIISNNITIIPTEAFAGCNNLTSVIIPDGVVTIKEYAFDSCNNLLSVTIPNSVTSIENDAFCSCDNLKTIYCKQNSYADTWASSSSQFSIEYI